MSDGALIRPTLALLRILLADHGSERGDRVVMTMRDDLGGIPDPGRADHAVRLRTCLNQWTCRIPVPAPGQDDLLAASLAAWWPAARDGLPPDGERLAELSDAQLDGISRAYASVCAQPAAVNKAGRGRSLGPTATAKLLYFLRPAAIPPWDKAISVATGGGSDGAAFRAHLSLCRSWARELEAEGHLLGVAPGELGAHLGRPLSSAARLIDEWLYETVTAGWRAAPEASPALT